MLSPRFGRSKAPCSLQTGEREERRQESKKNPNSFHREKTYFSHLHAPRRALVLGRQKAEIPSQPQRHILQLPSCRSAEPSSPLRSAPSFHPLGIRDGKSQWSGTGWDEPRHRHGCCRRMGCFWPGNRSGAGTAHFWIDGEGRSRGGPWLPGKMPVPDASTRQSCCEKKFLLCFLVGDISPEMRENKQAKSKKVLGEDAAACPRSTQPWRGCGDAPTLVPTGSGCPTTPRLLHLCQSQRSTWCQKKMGFFWRRIGLNPAIVPPWVEGRFIPTFARAGGTAGILQPWP